MNSEQEAIVLSEEESNEIAKMMQERAKQNKQDDQLKKQIQQAFSGLKKSLKPHSKNKLIEIIWNQACEINELRQMGIVLLEENKALKGEKNDNDA